MVPPDSLQSPLDDAMLNAVPSGSVAVSVTTVEVDTPELVTRLA